MWKRIKRFFTDPTYQEGYEWACGQLLKEPETSIKDLFEFLEIASSTEYTPFDEGISDALDNFKRIWNVAALSGLPIKDPE